MTVAPSPLQFLEKCPKIDRSIWKPITYDLNDEEDYRNFSKILQSEKPFCCDEFYDQVKELVKCQQPRERLKDKALEEAIDSYINDRELHLIGNWVYYPWSNRMVHILAEKEFITVRTNRNHYKISPAERDALSVKKVGLIGLSVGQSVAVTMAMERSFGELRLADFDELELTNLNRIRTGLHNMGLKKTVAVAREIMEIDPYLNLTCFSEGLTEENLDSFFSEGGKLDLLIDECDGLDIKVLCRHKARSLRIPVVMEASDRGMVDVERFDLEPNRPILHGMIGDLNPEKLKTLKTNEDKIPYMLDLVGIETISTRAMASMLEIGETISTWPQLASAVTLGGGVTADVVRRIFLGQFSESGRYYVDVEAIIGNAPKKYSGNGQKDESGMERTSIKFGQVPEPSPRTHLTDEVAERIGAAACNAPSGGNLQPWRWTYTAGTLQLKHDETLISSFLDHNFIASYVALGASLENAKLQALQEGFCTHVDYFPSDEQPDIIAHLRFEKMRAELDDNEKLLSKNVLNRETNRNIEEGDLLDAKQKTLLCELATANGSQLLLIDDEEDKEILSGLIAFAERFRILHPTGHQNFVEEMRWSREDALKTRDGIDIATCDLTAGELAGFKLARHRNVIDKLVEWGGGSAFEKLSRKSTSAAGALGIICRPSYSKLDFVKAGSDMERVWIGANAQGIGFQPQSPLTLILQRLESSADLDSNQVKELKAAHHDLQRILQKYSKLNPVFIFRLFNAKKSVVKSMRRPLSEHFKIA